MSASEVISSASLDNDVCETHVPSASKDNSEFAEAILTSGKLSLDAGAALNINGSFSQDNSRKITVPESFLTECPLKTCLNLEQRDISSHETDDMELIHETDTTSITYSSCKGDDTNCGSLTQSTVDRYYAKLQENSVENFDDFASEVMNLTKKVSNNSYNNDNDKCFEMVSKLSSCKLGKVEEQECMSANIIDTDLLSSCKQSVEQTGTRKSPAIEQVSENVSMSSKQRPNDKHQHNACVSIVPDSKPGKKFKGCSDFMNKCIDNLRQRGLGLTSYVQESKTASPIAESVEAVKDFDGNVENVNFGMNTRNHRKSRKPTKLLHRVPILNDNTQSEHEDEQFTDIEIVAATKTLPVLCPNCTFTCNTQSELTEHESVAHTAGKNRDASKCMFSCTYCKTPAEDRMQLRYHLAHHTGSHVFRCFTCPYCSTHADNMDSMDEHIGNEHPTEDFRFEVKQERVTYLQDMLECPICSGAFIWRSNFVSHIALSHHLKEVASYLEQQFPETRTPTICHIPKRLFEDPVDSTTNCQESQDPAQKEYERHFGTSSEYLLNMEKIVDKFFLQNDRASADKNEARNDSDSNKSLVAKAVNKDVWLTSDSPIAAESEPQSFYPDHSSSCHKTVNIHESTKTQQSLSHWKEYPDVNSSSSVVQDEPDVNSAVCDSDELGAQLITSGRRTILCCRLCPFVCNRTPNFRRHMAIHERQAEYGDGYRCAYCRFQHRRLNCIRFHLGKYHGHLPVRMYRIINGVQTEVFDSDNPALVQKGGDYSLANESDGDDLMDSSLMVKRNTDRVIDQDNTTLAENVVREKRLSKPPKRLSETLEFQPPISSVFRQRRISVEHGDVGGPHVPGVVGRTSLPSSSFDTRASSEQPPFSVTRGYSGKPFDENIASDYYQSSLPPGMIYQKPMKCPRCDFTNRVRINLVRHMKQHQVEDEQGVPVDNHDSCMEIATNPQPESSWINTASLKHRNQSPLNQLSHCTSSSIKDGDMTRQRNDVIVKSEPVDEAGWNNGKNSVEMENNGFMSDLPGMQGSHSYSDSPLYPVNRSSSSQQNHNISEISNEASQMSRKRPSSLLQESEHHGFMGIVNENDAGLFRTYKLMKKEGGLLDADGDGQNTKRLFKCAYCSVSSRWNRRDISLHILHVHIRRRAFRCRRCGYSTSKSAAAVTVHCARTHPGRPAIIEDNLNILNAILPVHARPGLVNVAFRRPDGTPEYDLRSLEAFFGLSHDPNYDVIETNPKLESRTQMTAKRLPSPPQQILSVPAPSSLPLDLSANAQLHKFSGKTERQRMNQVLGESDCYALKEKPIESLYGEKSAGKSNASVKSCVSPVALPHKSKSPPVSTSSLSLPSGGVTQQPKRPSQPSANAAFYRCRQCGYQDVRHDKTKYHVVREHLHLGPYGCVYCPRYMWGRRHVARHIDASHPGMPVKIRRAFDEFETYLRQNIRKIGGMPERTKYSNQMSQIKQQSFESINVADITPSSGGSDKRQHLSPIDVASEASGRMRHLQIIYQCGHCDYRDGLAARVQGHCLAKHPSKPVHYQRFDVEMPCTSSTTTASSFSSGTGLRIESVESLSYSNKKYNTSDERENVLHRESRNTELSTRSYREHSQPRDVVDTDEGCVVGKRQDVRLSDWFDKQVACQNMLSVDDDLDAEPAYNCHYCPEIAWNEDDIQMHVMMSHPGQPLRYGHTKISCNNQLADVKMEKCSDDASSDDDQPDTDGNEDKGQVNGFYVYRCRLCPYRSDKITVVRHHVMAHLLYHPYRCPYCDTVRSVKSSPITKHIRGRHPGHAQTFICLRDEEKERQVKNNYYRSEPNAEEDSVPPPPPIARRAVRDAALMTSSSSPPLVSNPVSVSPSCDDSIDEKSSLARRNTGRKSQYRCKFCGLTTYVRTDMRHHLMREIAYKPFRCGHCYAAGAGYAEPSRSAMGKHFRMRHAGMTVDVHDLSDPVKDAEVLELLDNSLVIIDDDDADSGNKVDNVVPPTTVGGVAIKRMQPKVAMPATEPLLTTSTSLSVESNVNHLGDASAVRDRGHDPPVDRDHTLTERYSSPRKKSRIMSSRLRRCQHCSYTTHSPKALAQHVAVRHRPRGLQCAYCDHMAHYPSWLRKHSEKTHPNMPFKFVQLGGPDEPVKYDGEDVDDESENGINESSGSSINEAGSESGGTSSNSTQAADNNNTALSILDGVEVDIPMRTNSLGLYHCPVCAYQTSNKAHFRMHYMIHRPRKWQCIYCRLKFPLLFRLRHHYTTKHPGMPVQWRDLSNGQLCDNSTKLAPPLPSTNCTDKHSSPTQVATASKKYTARKSFTPSGIRVAMFRCGQYFSIRRFEPSIKQDHSSDDEPDNIAYCCHICTYYSDSIESFWKHLRVRHRWGDPREMYGYPQIKVLSGADPRIGANVLQQCGFCTYESFDGLQFACHVAEMHNHGPPISCTVCGEFASFSEYEVMQHISKQHPTSVERGTKALTKLYTMSTRMNDNTDKKCDSMSFHVDPYIVLTKLPTDSL